MRSFLMHTNLEHAPSISFAPFSSQGMASSRQASARLIFQYNSSFRATMPSSMEHLGAGPVRAPFPSAFLCNLGKVLGCGPRRFPIFMSDDPATGFGRTSGELVTDTTVLFCRGASPLRVASEVRGLFPARQLPPRQVGEHGLELRQRHGNLERDLGVDSLGLLEEADLGDDRGPEVRRGSVARKAMLERALKARVCIRLGSTITKSCQDTSSFSPCLCESATRGRHVRRGPLAPDHQSGSAVNARQIPHLPALEHRAIRRPARESCRGGRCASCTTRFVL